MQTDPEKRSLEQLLAIFGAEGVITDPDTLLRYSRDQVADADYAVIPAAVVRPTETRQVAELMRWANETGVPVTPRGGGSGLAGAAIPLPGGVVCSFEKMNRILDIDTENMMVVVEPGVITNDLDRALEPHGLFFAGYPMSEDICFIGGNVAENAGGGRAVKYGTTGTWVTGAEIVTPTGDLLRLGGKRLKDVTGYNLLHLMIGSEGTLGLFTELTIRVIPRPSVRGVALLAFRDHRSATTAVATFKRSPSLSAVEFMDGETARRANSGLPRKKQLAVPETAGAFLLVEFDGDDPATVERALTAAADQARRAWRDAGEPHPADTAATLAAHERTDPVIALGTDRTSGDRAWTLRKAVPWWVKRTAPGYHSVEDVVVPPSEIPALVEYAEHLRHKYQVPIAVFGHAGDGNFHINPMKPPELSPDEWPDLVDSLRHDLYHRVVELGGTISGEHGIGRKRVRYVPLALTREEIHAMTAIKRALDPGNILNAGVVFGLD